MNVKLSVRSKRRLQRHKYPRVRTSLFTEAGGPAVHSIWYNLATNVLHEVESVDRYYVHTDVIGFRRSEFSARVEDGSFVLVGVRPDNFAHLHV